MKYRRPPCPHLPPDEDRNAAIVYVAHARAAKKLHLLKVATRVVGRYIATFRLVAHRVLITYTPSNARNLQSSDWVRV